VRRNPQHRILVEKPESKKPLGRPKGRWDDNIKVNLKAVGWESMDKWLALVNKAMNLQVA
jgi:hypothetical protein